MPKIYQSIKKYGAVPVASGLAVLSTVPAYASTVTSDDWAPIISAITGQLSVATVVQVIAVAIAACIGLVFMWWGARKAISTFMSAFRKGKVSA